MPAMRTGLESGFRKVASPRILAGSAAIASCNSRSIEAAVWGEIRCQLSAISYQLSAISYLLTADS